MPNPEYAAYEAAAAYKPLGDIVDGEHFFEIITDEGVDEGAL